MMRGLEWFWIRREGGGVEKEEEVKWEEVKKRMKGETRNGSTD